MIANARNVEEVILVAVHAAHVFIPIHARGRCGRRHHWLALAFEESLFVVVFPRIAIVFHGRQLAGLERPIFPAAADAVPLARIAETRTGLHVVPIHVAGPVAVGPKLLAGDGAGLASQAFVQVHHHRILMFRHDCASSDLRLLDFHLDVAVIAGRAPVVQAEVHVSVFADELCGLDLDVGQ